MAGLASGLDDLAECVNPKVGENCCFRISDLSIEFPEVSKTTLLRIVTSILGYCTLCAKCWQMFTKTRDRYVHVISWTAFIEWEMNFVPILSLAMKHGFHMSMLNWNNNPCGDTISVHPNQKHSSKPSLKGKSWQLCSGTKRVCLWSIFWSLEKPSLCKSIVKHFLNCTVPFNTNNEVCWSQELLSFTITHVHTWLPTQFNNSNIPIGGFKETEELKTSV